jgi:tetratricopeptide (TPR) repeat protein
MMVRSRTARKLPDYTNLLEERVDLLFDELSFAIQWQRPSILLVFYESEHERDTVELALEKRLAEIGQQVTQFRVDEEHFDIPRLLSQYPDRDRSVFSVISLSRGGGKGGANAYRALNIRREYFVDFAIRVIIWLTTDEAIELSRHAPDFWAFRHRVVELSNSLESDRQSIPANELPERAQGVPDQPEALDEQIEQSEASIANLPNRAETISMRLDLLLTLASLYQAKEAYDQSIHRLKQGLEIARLVNDPGLLAKYWGQMGSVYLDLDRLNSAVRAYKKAIRFTPNDASLWIGLGHVYRMEERLSDAIIAYQQAIRLDPQNSSANSSAVACYRLLGKDDLVEKQRNLVLPNMENEAEYNKAVFESVSGNTSKAIDLLAIALEKNQAGLNELRRDLNLDFIRADPEYRKLLGKHFRIMP